MDRIKCRNCGKEIHLDKEVLRNISGSDGRNCWDCRNPREKFEQEKRRKEEEEGMYAPFEEEKDNDEKKWDFLRGFVLFVVLLSAAVVFVRFNGPSVEYPLGSIAVGFRGVYLQIPGIVVILVLPIVAVYFLYKEIKKFM